MILTEEEKQTFLDIVCPLGQVPYYDEVLKEVTFSKTDIRRFILDSTYVNRTVRPNTLIEKDKIDLGYIGFGIFESIAVLLQKDYSLYKKLFEFFDRADKLTSEMISSCSHAIVLLSHKSFGDRVFPHIHQDSGENLKTLSVFFKLTNTTNDAPVLTLLDNVEKDSKFFKKGYTDHKVLLVHERKSTVRDEVNISNNMCILFDADKIPHTLTYTDDIWLTIVYDHVTPVYNLNDKGRYHVGTIQL